MYSIQQVSAYYQEKLFSGNANNGSNTEVGNFNSSNSVSNGNANIAFQSYCDKNLYEMKHDDLASWQKSKQFKAVLVGVIRRLGINHKKMKRIGNIYKDICNLGMIDAADSNARKGKHNYGIKRYDKHKEEYDKKLLDSLSNHTFKVSEYDVFKIYEPKERLIYRLPYYPDRIMQWDLMLTLEPIWTKIFIKNTYACIKGRGIHKCAKDVRKALDKDRRGTRYCLKLDIRKFYPSIDHDILKQIVRKKIKDKDLLIELDKLIDSSPGVPIGNYTSQFLANLYLAYFDHWVKEVLKVKYYFRYADDIVILDDDKDALRVLLEKIKIYLNSNLKLHVKPNWQVFPVDSRGLDFVGYVFFHNRTRLRKGIKLRVYRLICRYKARKIDKDRFYRGMASYWGWVKYCDNIGLVNHINRTIIEINNNGKL